MHRCGSPGCALLGALLGLGVDPLRDVGRRELDPASGWTLRTEVKTIVSADAIGTVGGFRGIVMKGDLLASALARLLPMFDQVEASLILAVEVMEANLRLVREWARHTGETSDPLHEPYPEDLASRRSTPRATSGPWCPTTPARRAASPSSPSR